MADGQFRYPEAITLDHKGQVYIADPATDQVRESTNEGALIALWRKRGTHSDLGLFRGPAGVGSDGKGNVYMAGASNSRLQKFRSIMPALASGGGAVMVRETSTSTKLPAS